jgi:hypothetical protein
MIPAQGRVMVYGEGGSFKTTILLDLAVAYASGGMLLESFNLRKFGAVLVNSTEGSIFDNQARIKAHLMLRGCAPDVVKLYFCQTPFLFDEEADMAELEQVIEHFGIRLLICDPLDSFFLGEENSATETKTIRRRADYLIRKYDMTIVFIHHATKDAKNYRGSSAWRGWIDVLLRVDKNEINLGLPEPMRMASVAAEKVRNGKEGPLFSIVPVIGEAYSSIKFAFFDGKDTDSVLRVLSQQRVYKLLLDTPRPMLQTEMATILGLPPASVSRALLDLEQVYLAAKDATVERSTSPDGSRTRSVAAWRAVRVVNMVEAAQIMLRMKENEAAADSETYTLNPLR